MRRVVATLSDLRRTGAKIRLLVISGVMITLLAGCGSQGTNTTTSAVVEPPSPCGSAPPETASYSHVIWLWMENHDYDQVIGSSAAPYLNALAAKCGLATNYHNISHRQPAELHRRDLRPRLPRLWSGSRATAIPLHPAR